MVAGRISGKQQIRRRSSPEGGFRKSTVGGAQYGCGIEVVVDDGVDRMIADVRYIQNEAPRQRPLDGRIPRFYIRVLEVGIHHKEVGKFECRGRRCAGCAGDDPVRRNYRENEIGEAILESRNLPSRKHCGIKGSKRWVEGVIGTHREVVRVAVVGKRRIADPESSAKYGRFLP